MEKRNIHIVIVAHNSQDVLPKCLKCLNDESSDFASVIVVDNGSSDRSYLEPFPYDLPIEVIRCDNRGFAAANNIGFQAILKKEPHPSDLLLFLNPDAYLKTGWIKKAVSVFDNNPDTGAVTGKLLGYDLQKNDATGKLDSTGIFRKWYGRWYDRGHGVADLGQYDVAECVPAICGALFCCRIKSLQQCMLPGNRVFDDDFFLYKEDIELSLRLRSSGWKLYYDPTLEAFHCRGWNEKRSEVQYEMRLMSAGNEVLLYKKHISPYIAWAAFKYLLVRFFRL
jgi:N-acetylglucosaminyl-diphospho-decaprenol L-rhamnosyltransferase